MDNPLLSICIPTYNRAEYLKECLDSIVTQERFEEIEVVISDNCSNDGTQKLGEKYARMYENIRYYRNDENVMDMNYPIAFRRAHGVLRKLTNDTVLYKPGAIKYMLEATYDNIHEKPQIYFLNCEDDGVIPRRYDRLEDYVRDIGYFLTWIRSVAVWDVDVYDLDTFTNNTDSKLAQVPYLLEHFEKHHGAVVFPKNIMDGISPQNKNLTYGLYQVFYVNFLGFLRFYVTQGKISSECYEAVRKNLLLDFFSQWIVNWMINQNQFRFSKDENLKELVENAYKNEVYFKQYKCKLIKLFIWGVLHKIIRRR